MNNLQISKEYSCILMFLLSLIAIEHLLMIIGTRYIVWTRVDYFSETCFTICTDRWESSGLQGDLGELRR